MLHVGKSRITSIHVRHRGDDDDGADEGLPRQKERTPPRYSTYVGRALIFHALTLNLPACVLVAHLPTFGGTPRKKQGHIIGSDDKVSV